MKRTLLLVFAVVGYASLVTFAQTKQRHRSFERSGVVRDIPAPPAPSAPVPPPPPPVPEKPSVMDQVPAPPPPPPAPVAPEAPDEA